MLHSHITAAEVFFLVFPLQSLHSLSDPPNIKDWSEISAYSDPAVGTARSAASKLLRELYNVLSDETKGLIAKGELEGDTSCLFSTH